MSPDKDKGIRLTSITSVGTGQEPPPDAPDWVKQTYAQLRDREARQPKVGRPAGRRNTHSKGETAYRPRHQDGWEIPRIADLIYKDDELPPADPARAVSSLIYEYKRRLKRQQQNG